MSPIKKFVILGALVISTLLNSGCGSSTTNEKGSNNHQAANWQAAGHMNAAKADQNSCAECHGSDLSGGIAGVSCTQCHLGGVTSIHPASWTDPIALSHGPIVAINGAGSCASLYCHGTSLAGVAGSGPSCLTSCHLGEATSAHPASWGTGSAIDLNHAPYVAANGNMACRNGNCHGSSLTGVTNSGPSCSSCHIGGIGSVHPTSWGTGTQVDLNHGSFVTANGATSCSNVSCHGASLTGGAGPACSTCHVNGSPITSTNCTSCHGKPPAGAVAPDRSGAHAVHNALPNVTDVCNSCHNGAGSGTLNHFNNVANVAFLSAYNSKSGAAVRNLDGTCSKVSCHGGQTTPDWSSGANIDVATECVLCHSYGAAEYNSFASGQHEVHVNGESIGCVSCHDSAKLDPNHFAHLDTPLMEGPASATLNNALGYNGASCTGYCHEMRDW